MASFAAVLRARDATAHGRVCSASEGMLDRTKGVSPVVGKPRLEEDEEDDEK